MRCNDFSKVHFPPSIAPTKARITPNQNGKPTKKNNTKNIAKEQEDLIHQKISEQIHQTKTIENPF